MPKKLVRLRTRPLRDGTEFTFMLDYVDENGLRHLKRFFQLAVDRGQLDQNPLARIRQPKTPKKKVRVYSRDEYDRLLRA